MDYTDKEKEHIMHLFDLFCKRAIRRKAYSMHNQNKRIRERYILKRFIMNTLMSVAVLMNIQYCNIILKPLVMCSQSTITSSEMPCQNLKNQNES